MTEAENGKPTVARLGATIDYGKFLDCVHCGLCTSACPTYLETGDENNGPRGRIYLMRAITDGRLELTDSVSRHLDLCLDCRSCETACPSGVQYGRLIEPFRLAMKQQPAATPPSLFNRWFDRFILHGLFPYPSRLRATLAPAAIAQWSGLEALAKRLGLLKFLPERLQRMHRLLPKLTASLPPLPEFLPAEGTRRARVSLLTGCVADVLFRRVHWATARVLQANGCDVLVPRQQECCGAIHYHSGAAAPAVEFARRNSLALNGDDVDAVIVNVAGCGAMLKDYGHLAEETPGTPASVAEQLQGLALKVRDVSEFLNQLGIVPPSGPLPVRATYHDACHLAHAQKVRDAPRRLLEQIPGLTLIPMNESDICCGAAGSYNLTEGAMADRLAQRKLENILDTAADVVVSANAGCSLQIQASLKDAGRPMPVVHPVELLDLSYRKITPDWARR